MYDNYVNIQHYHVNIHHNYVNMQQRYVSMLDNVFILTCDLNPVTYFKHTNYVAHLQGISCMLVNDQ